MKISSFESKTNMVQRLNLLASTETPNIKESFSHEKFNHSQIKASTATPAYFHPSFCGGKSLKVSTKVKKAIKTNLENKEKFNESFKQALDALKKEGKLIAKGHENEVYKINDKYVLKIIANSDGPFYSPTVNDNSKLKGLKVWDGQVLAEIGPAKILRNADPKGDAMQCGAPSFRSSIDIGNIKSKKYGEFLDEYYTGVKEYYNEKYLPKMTALPQSAFDNVAKDLKTLNSLKDEKYYSIMSQDPANFLIVGDKIKIVGQVKKTYGKNVNCVTQMLNPFLCKYHGDGDSRFKPLFDEKLVPMRKEIFKKCIIASEKAQLPLELDYFDTNVLNESAKLAGFESTETEKSGERIKNKLIEYRNEIPNLSQRIKKVEEYLSTEK